MKSVDISVKGLACKMAILIIIIQYVWSNGKAGGTDSMEFLSAQILFIWEKPITAMYMYIKGGNISYKSWTTYTGNRMKKYRSSGRL